MIQMKEIKFFLILKQQMNSLKVLGLHQIHQDCAFQYLRYLISIFHYY